jgi:hypothetical protein
MKWMHERWNFCDKYATFATSNASPARDRAVGLELRELLGGERKHDVLDEKSARDRCNGNQ